MQQLSAQDASFVYLETSAAPMHVGSLGIYDGTNAVAQRLTEEAILKNVGERLHLAPTARRRLVRVPFEADYPYWIEDRDFDLEYHVRRVALPKPGDRAALQKLASRIFARPLDMTKPLWELYVIEGLDNVAGVPKDSFAVLTKTHHAAVDGASGLHFLELLHDRSAEPAKIPMAKEQWRPEPVPSDAELLMRSTLHNIGQPLRLAKTMVRQFSKHVRNNNWQQNWPAPSFFNQASAGATPTFTRLPRISRKVPKTRFNGKVTAHRVMGSVNIALDDIRTIRHAVPGCTVNDVVLSICGGALRNYLSAKNELDENPLVAMAPVNIRTPSESSGQGGNRVAALFIPLGTDVEDDVERLTGIHTQTSNSKLMLKAVDAAAMTDYGKFVPAFSAALASRLMAETAASAPEPPFNVSITNVPGPQEPLFFSSAPLVAALGIGPITQGMGLIFPVLSYCGRLTISFTSCREIIPDPDFFEACIDTSFTDLLAQTS